VTSYEFSEMFQRLLKANSEQGFLVGSIAVLSGIRRQITTALTGQIKVEQEVDIVRGVGAARNLLNSAVKTIVDLQPSRMFKELGLLEHSLREIAKVAGAEKQDDLSMLPNLLSYFGSSYEKTIQTRNPYDALRTIEMADDFQSALTATTKMGHYIERNLLAHSPPPDSFRDLALRIPEEGDVAHVAARLNILQKLYAELCAILEISSQEFPLIIVHIEVGTLDLILRGNDKVIEVLDKWVSALVGWIYRTYTTEGRESVRIPNKAADVARVLEMRNTLEAAGLETKKIDAAIERAAVDVANELIKLVKGQPSITINGKTHELTTAEEQLLIAADERKLITDQTDKPTRPKGENE
jgi:hypothetical protein